MKEREKKKEEEGCRLLRGRGKKFGRCFSSVKCTDHTGRDAFLLGQLQRAMPHYRKYGRALSRNRQVDHEASELQLHFTSYLGFGLLFPGIVVICGFNHGHPLS